MKLTKNFFSKSLYILVASAVFSNAMAQSVPIVKVTSDTQELMGSLFSEPVKADNVKITGNPNQIGVFSGAKNLLDVEDGVVISTGFASETFKVQGKSHPEYQYGQLEQARAPQPEEDLPDITGLEDDYMFDDDGPTDEQKTEDKDIENESGNKHSYDSASLEFDIVPSSDKIKLQYVYASNEWQRVFNQYPPETVDNIPDVRSQGNLINKYPVPDDTAVVMVNGENVAKVPNTGAVLSAKNILEASGYDTSKPGPEPGEGRFGTQGLFIDSVNNHDFGFLGRTKLMEAQADVNAGEVNHIKIAVADLEDPFFNTAIFLKLTVEEESVENPKTGDISLYSIMASTLASATGLAVLVNKSRKK